MGVVANFTENMTVKKIENRSTFVKLMNECIVAQFLLSACIGLYITSQISLFSV